MQKSMYEKAKGIFFEPKSFFRSLDEKSIKPAFFYSIVLSLIGLILSSVTGYLMYPDLYGGWMFLWIFVLWVFSVLAFNFIMAGILHVWILIFGGKEEYSKTYQLMIYAMTPSYVLRWIPFVGAIGSIYSIVLLIIGTEQMHKLSRTKAILMYVIPIAVLLIVGLVLLGFAAVILLSNPDLMNNITYAP